MKNKDKFLLYIFYGLSHPVISAASFAICFYFDLSIKYANNKLGISPIYAILIIFFYFVIMKAKYKLVIKIKNLHHIDEKIFWKITKQSQSVHIPFIFINILFLTGIEANIGGFIFLFSFYLLGPFLFFISSIIFIFILFKKSRVPN